MLGLQPRGCWDTQSRPWPPPDLLTWQWRPRGKLCRPGLGRWRVQEGGSQLGLPQALVRWGQQRRGPWWLEVVKGSLLWGHPRLGLREQKCGSEAPVRRPRPTTEPLAQKVLRASQPSSVWGPGKTHRQELAGWSSHLL